MEGTIQEFILDTKRGPFKCLRDYNCEATATESISASCYIVKQNENKKYTGIEMDNDNTIILYQYAVYQAWLDMCRTVPGAGNKKKQQCQDAREKAASILQEYFLGEPKESENDFDGWLRYALDEVSKQAKLTIGQSQKIINMAFKYLYCCEDIRGKYNKHFAYCHMPLDSYTLNWYSGDKKYQGTPWSKINAICEYFDIQNRIRDRLCHGNVLLEEFSIWLEEKKKQTKK